MFVQIPQVLNTDQLATIRTALQGDTAPWVDGRVTAGHQGALVKSNRQLEEGSAVAHELGTLVITALERNPLFVSVVLPHRVYPPMFNRYDAGMHFGSHRSGKSRVPVKNCVPTCPPRYFCRRRRPMTGASW
jgi:PKHD-type hydroxylase